MIFPFTVLPAPTGGFPDIDTNDTSTSNDTVDSSVVITNPPAARNSTSGKAVADMLATYQQSISNLGTAKRGVEGKALDAPILDMFNFICEDPQGMNEQQAQRARQLNVPDGMIRRGLSICRAEVVSATRMHWKAAVEEEREYSRELKAKVKKLHDAYWNAKNRKM